ncbi:hypothetical protein AXF42_Ash011262 [Apostasia shenzhenica]|uniref:Integrase catalytic domain-containing protein n=1 Tax=Apostasia shenzhenica TaxID=1088818 RepID=A0A2I0AE18_9ASPA|nr:hypothetical protein AXF42_Ash011262 [Apostasia shenzhenica]
MDFIEGLPSSNGKSVTFVVVDRLMVISDRDPIFISRFWRDFLKLQGVIQHMSTTYHPQTDGQTKVVNRCLEIYLRCMTYERPKQWIKWLSLAELGDFVFVKLKPYRQDSVARRLSHKLSPRYFGPFPIDEKIGAVAYKLKLPENSRIHPVFHVSMLKRHIGNRPAESNFPFMLNDHRQVILEPVAILDRRLVKKRERIQVQLLNQWSNSSKEDATWVSAEVIRQNFPCFNLNP